MGACLVWGLPRRAGLRPHMTLTRAHMNPVGTARRYSASPSPSPPKTKGLVQMATHTVNIAHRVRQPLSRSCSGGWLLAHRLYHSAGLPRFSRGPCDRCRLCRILISGEGQTYAETEADEWLAQTGWLKLERKPLVGPSSVIIAEAV